MYHKLLMIFNNNNKLILSALDILKPSPDYYQSTSVYLALSVQKRNQ